MCNSFFKPQFIHFWMKNNNLKSHNLKYTTVYKSLKKIVVLDIMNLNFMVCTQCKSSLEMEVFQTVSATPSTDLPRMYKGSHCYYHAVMWKVSVFMVVVYISYVYYYIGCSIQCWESVSLWQCSAMGAGTWCALEVIIVIWVRVQVKFAVS